MKTTTVERSRSGELSPLGSPTRVPAKSVVVATAQRPGNAAVSGLGTVAAQRDATRFGVSGGDAGKSVAVLERPVRPNGAFVPPGGAGTVVTLSQPTVVARRDSSHAEPYSGETQGAASSPGRDGASDSFDEASRMEDTVRDALGQEAEMLETGIEFEALRDILRAEQAMADVLNEATRSGFSHAVRFASTD